MFAARHVGGKTQWSELGWRRHVDAEDLLEVLNRFVHVPDDDADMRDGEARHRRRALAAELLDRGDETNHPKYHDDAFQWSFQVSACFLVFDADRQMSEGDRSTRPCAPDGHPALEPRCRELGISV